MHFVAEATCDVSLCFVQIYVFVSCRRVDVPLVIDLEWDATTNPFRARHALPVPDEILPELIHDLLRRRCEHYYLLGLGRIALGYCIAAHVEMNVVGASETVVPHAVAEGYQRTKRYAKRYD